MFQSAELTNARRSASSTTVPVSFAPAAGMTAIERGAKYRTRVSTVNAWIGASASSSGRRCAAKWCGGQRCLRNRVVANALLSSS